ncbi:hypothetical protein D3C72_1864770 [compost metagenome]
MIAVGVETDGLAGRQVDALHLLHAHDIVVHGHLVHLDDFSHGRLHIHQLAVAAGGEGHEGTGRLLVRHSGTNPGIFNAGVGHGWQRQANQGQGSQGAFERLGWVTHQHTSMTVSRSSVHSLAVSEWDSPRRNWPRESKT